MESCREVGNPVVWLVQVEPSITKILTPLSDVLGVNFNQEADFSHVPEGAFVIVQCAGPVSSVYQALCAWVNHLAPDQGVVWLLASCPLEVHWQESLPPGITDISPVSADHAEILHRFKLMLELWQRRCLATREHLAMNALQYEYEQVIAQLEEGLFILDKNGYILQANSSACDMLVSSPEQLLGSHIARLLADPAAQDPLLDWCEHALFTPIIRGEAIQLEDTFFWRADGERLPVTCRMQPLETFDDRRLILVFNDISVRKAEEAIVDQLTRYDAVTGLANAPLMRHFLLKAMARALRNDRLLAVLHVDLDDFGCINERFGRKAGNQLLRSVGRRLRGCIRTGDLVSRYHEDTFIIVLDEVRSTEDAERAAEQILHKLAPPHDIGSQVVIHASIGLAFYPSGSIGIDTLLQRATDAAMQVKKQGKNNYLAHTHEAVSPPTRILSEVH